jgi:hypothetical protein
MGGVVRRGARRRGPGARQRVARMETAPAAPPSGTARHAADGIRQYLRSYATAVPVPPDYSRGLPTAGHMRSLPRWLRTVTSTTAPKPFTATDRRLWTSVTQVSS